MANYFANMQTREPHERRRHALGWAAGLTAVVFLFWITTLGVRLNAQSAKQAELSAAAAQAQAANQTQLQVSPTSVYSQ